MSPEVIYFLKVNIALALFYAFYKLFFSKDTFFQWRRIALLSFMLVSFAYPLLNIQDWVKEQEPIAAMADIYASTILPEIRVTDSQAEATTGWVSTILTHSRYIFPGVCALLLLRLVIQLVGLAVFARRCKSRLIGSVKVYIPQKVTGPFSFFKWIFIRPDDHSTEELNEILTHELTHARQWHSVDVILGELMCVVCWINPFAWLLNRELRCNLEYLADHKVLETGHDCKIYQYHLLTLTYRKEVATLYNSFNVLPLKNRIQMMNKKRTKQIGATKYLVFPMLAAILLLTSNIESIARTTENVVESIAVMNEPELQVDQQDPIYETPERMPEFPGGVSAFLKYLSTNVKYPVTAANKGIQGRVVITFIVNKDGTVSDPVIKRSVDPELDAEAVRVVNNMPKFTPAQQNGENVRSYYTVPIMFKLDKPTPTDEGKPELQMNSI